MEKKIELKVYSHENNYGERTYNFDILFNGVEVEELTGEALSDSSGNWELEIDYAFLNLRERLKFDKHEIRGTFNNVRKFIEKNWNIIEDWLKKEMEEQQRIINKNKSVLKGEIICEMKRIGKGVQCPFCHKSLTKRVWNYLTEGRTEEQIWCLNCDSRWLEQNGMFIPYEQKDNPNKEEKKPCSDGLQTNTNP